LTLLRCYQEREVSCRCIVGFGMKGSQFKQLPSREQVEHLFHAITGKSILPKATWITWEPKDSWIHLIPPFEQYIRPCHRLLIRSLLKGYTNDPCSFLRQLLRPFGLHIVIETRQADGASYSRYILREIKEEITHPVIHKEPIWMW